MSRRRKAVKTQLGEEDEDPHQIPSIGKPVSHVQAEASAPRKPSKSAAPRSWRASTVTISVLVAIIAGVVWHHASSDTALHQQLRDLKDDVSNTLSSLQEQNPIYTWWSGTNRSTHPGVVAARAGLRPQYNVVLVPGFVTTGLEVWHGTINCSDYSHRQRIWGGIGMPFAARAAQCWLNALAMDPATGSDRSDLQLRAMQGFSGIDFFVPGYVVWAGVMQTLADMGAGTLVDLHPAPYDWRLPMHLMEHRDAWFSHLKAHIETSYAHNGRKSMIMAHSWGANVVLHFLYWVDTLEPGWVERHVGVFANVAGPLLGVPKSLSPLLSGEVKDLVQLGSIIRNLIDWTVSPEERASAFRTWGSALQMLPVGGTRVWGNATHAPDDPVTLNGQLSFGNVMRVDADTDNGVFEGQVLSVPQALRILLEEGGEFADHVRAWTPSSTLSDALQSPLTSDPPWLRASSVAGHTHPTPQSDSSPPPDAPPLSPTAQLLLPTKDPLTTPLPSAPSLQIFCMHGVGIPTERGYRYRYQQGGGQPGVWRLNETDGEEGGPVVVTDGDATVPLLSLGGVCGSPWHSRALNPSGVRVVTRQYKHGGTAVMGQGPESADHVDVLQNKHFIEDVLTIVAGKGASLDDRLYSDVARISANLWRAYT